MSALTLALCLSVAIGVTYSPISHAQTTPPPRQNPSATTTAPKPSAPTAGTATTASQFATEGEAKRHCASDTVVWVNNQSKVFHLAGTKYYGKTKQGAYMCQQDSERSGFSAAKNEKMPAKKS
jgi:hypothetical protein